MGEYRTLTPTTFLIGNLAMGDNGGTAAEIYPLPKMRATSVIFKRLPKVNNHPIVDFSPNLVALLLSLVADK
jgi:hypothetical protein